MSVALAVLGIACSCLKGHEASLLGQASGCAVLRILSFAHVLVVPRSVLPFHCLAVDSRLRPSPSLRTLASLAYFALDRRSTSTSCRVSLSRPPWRSAGLARSCARRYIDGSAMNGFPTSVPGLICSLTRRTQDRLARSRDASPSRLLEHVALRDVVSVSVRA